MDKKPIRQETVWHLKKEFVDVNGDVYKKGVFSGETREPSSEDIDWLTRNGYDGYGNKITSETNKATNIVESKRNTEDVEKEDKYVELEKKYQQQQELINKLLLQKDDKKYIIKAEEEKRFGTVLTKDIPPEDYQKEKAIFYMQGGGTVLSSYKVDGQEFKPPYDMPIHFKREHTESKVNGKFQEHIHISIYETHSKKEIEYIKKYPQFGITVWEKMSEALQFTSQYYIKLRNMAASIELLSGDKLLTAAISCGVNITNKTREQVKLELITHRIAELQERENRQRDNIISKTMESKVFQ